MVYPFFSLFCRMGCCWKCAPCFRKNCGVCGNCLTNHEGKRVHKKCVERICWRDRKWQLKIANEKDIEFVAGKLKADLKSKEKLKKKLENAKLCQNHESIALQLTQAIKK